MAMLPSFCKETVTRMRPTAIESRGTVIHDWSHPDELSIAGCSVQPSGSARDFDGRTLQVEEDWVLYAPPGADIAAGDRIAWEGLTFEVDGAPMPWKSPTGRTSHVWANLTEWRG